MGDFNVVYSNGTTYNLAKHAAIVSKNSPISKVSAFDKIQITGINNKTQSLATATSGYIYSNNINFNGKLKVNGVAVPNVSKRGFRPLQKCSSIQLINHTEEKSIYIIKNADGSLVVDDRIYGTAAENCHSFFFFITGAGGNGGNNGTAWIGTGWSGAGGGSGGCICGCIVIPEGFTGVVARCDFTQGYVYLNWRNQSGVYLMAGRGGNGGNAVSGSAGGGAAGVCEDVGFSAAAGNQYHNLFFGNGVRGKHTKPKNDSFSSSIAKVNLPIYNPDNVVDSLYGGNCGYGDSINWGGPGAGGYHGNGGDSISDKTSGYNGTGFPGEATAGGGGACAAGNKSRIGGSGGKAAFEIYF